MPEAVHHGRRYLPHAGPHIVTGNLIALGVGFLFGVAAAGVAILILKI